MYKCCFLSISWFLLTGCFFSSEESDVYIGHVDDNCNYAWTYPTEHRGRAVYVSPEHEAYEVFIDYSDVSDLFFSGWTAGALEPKEVAELAYYMSVATREYVEETEVQVSGKKLNNTLNKLKTTHYILHAEDDPDPYYWMWQPRLFDEDPEEARRTSIVAFYRKPICWDHPPEADISTVYKSRKYFNATVISHELTHAVGNHLFNDADSDHDDPRLWVGLYENSVQGRALKKFHEAREEKE